MRISGFFVSHMCGMGWARLLVLAVLFLCAEGAVWAQNAFALPPDSPYGDAPAAEAVSEPLVKNRFVFAQNQAAASMAFTDGEGRSYSLKNYAGKYVFLNVWATWCAPCAKEMPAINALAAQLAGSNIVVLALSQDMGGSVAVQSFLQKRNLQNITPFIDREGNAVSLFKLEGLPTTLIFGPDGREIGRVSNAFNWIYPENFNFLLEITGNKKRAPAQPVKSLNTP